MQKRQFDTFDAFRFLAFFKVFLLHLPVFTFPVFTFFKEGGNIGVNFFFVLSGFLITYLILYEKNLKGTFSLKNFFIRRILRIWPLFYLVLLLAMCAPFIISYFNLPYSNAGYEPNWLMSFLFLENYMMMINKMEPNVVPLGVMWTLCVEEHFYILWGLSLFFLKIKNIPKLILISILIANVTRIFYFVYDIGFIDVFSNLDYFAYGAIPAYLLVTKESLFTDFISKIRLDVKWLFIILLLLYIILSPNIFYTYKILIEPTIFGFGFFVLLSFTIPQNSKIKISDNNILSKLGIYTYGLYLFHPILTSISFKLFGYFKLPVETPLNAFLFSVCAFVLTVITAYLSYNLFEKKFLKLKNKFNY